MFFLLTQNKKLEKHATQSMAQQQSSGYPDDYLPVQSTLTENAQDGEYWKRMDQSIGNSINNVFKHHLPLNQHGADGSIILAEFEKTNIFVHYMLDFLCEKRFVVKQKRKSAKQDHEGDVEMTEAPHRRKKRKRKVQRRQQRENYVPIRAKIPDIDVDTQLPEYEARGNMHQNQFKIMDWNDESMSVYWTCDDAGLIDALSLRHRPNVNLMTTEISKDQCFAISLSDEELEAIRNAGWNEKNLVAAVCPFTTTELQGGDPELRFVNSAMQKRAILSALDALHVPLNDEDELFLVGQMALPQQDDSGDASLVFVSLRKGHSLIHMNLMNALSPGECEDDVASSDVSRLIPAQHRNNISQVT